MGKQGVKSPIWLVKVILTHLATTSQAEKAKASVVPRSVTRQWCSQTPLFRPAPIQPSCSTVPGECAHFDQICGPGRCCLVRQS